MSGLSPGSLDLQCRRRRLDWCSRGRRTRSRTDAHPPRSSHSRTSGTVRHVCTVTRTHTPPTHTHLPPTHTHTPPYSLPHLYGEPHSRYSFTERHTHIHTDVCTPPPKVHFLIRVDTPFTRRHIYTLSQRHTHVTDTYNFVRRRVHTYSYTTYMDTRTRRRTYPYVEAFGLSYSLSRSVTYPDTETLTRGNAQVALSQDVLKRHHPRVQLSSSTKVCPVDGPVLREENFRLVSGL